jgi:hypothetical protein
MSHKKKYLETIIRDYNEVANELVNRFAKKQDLYFDYWVADRVGEIGCFSHTYFFTLSDIIHDLESNQPKGLILEWQDKTLENDRENRINYYAYTTGLRYSELC